MSINSTKVLKNDNEMLLLQNKRNGATITPKKALETETSERTAFLTAEPVRLTPAWEEANVPDDELNFRTLEMNPPTDRYNIVYFIILLHGIGILTPWNMFITAKEYFVDYKLSKEYTGEDSMYGTNFLAFVGFAAQVPCVLLNWANIFVQLGGSLTKRIVWSITIISILFLFTVFLAMVDSSEWPGLFFWLTMISVVILNSANGIYQSSVFGMAANLPCKYSGTVVFGCNMSGAITSIISILSNSFTTNKRTAAIYYFIYALFVLLICFDTYFALPLNRYYRYHLLMNNKDKSKSSKSDIEGGSQSIPYWKVFKGAFPQLFNVFMVYFVTLAVFPAVNADIKQSDPNFVISDKMYTSITCFLTFNVTAMLGSWLTSFFSWPKPKYLNFVVLLRLLYIPLFLLMNYRPKNTSRTLPILIDNDWAYWIIAVTMGLTNGYYGALSMMYISTTVEPKYSGTAGMFGSAMLVTGILAGVLFSFLGPIIVANFPGFTVPI